MKIKIDYLLSKAFLSNKGWYLSAIDTSADSAGARKKKPNFSSSFGSSHLLFPHYWSLWAL